MAVANTFSSGVDTSFSTKLNQNADQAYQGTAILTTYTGTGFDTSRTIDGTDTDYHEISVGSAYIDEAGYIKVGINYIQTSYAQGNVSGGSADGSATIKVEKKDIGGSYATYYNEVVGRAAIGPNAHFYRDGIRDLGQTLIVPIALDSDDRTNGITVKITSTCTLDLGHSGTADLVESITNVYTWIEGAN